MHTGWRMYAVRVSVCVHYDKRTGAATRESLRRDRHGGITSPALLLAAGPVFFTQTVVKEAKTRTSTMPNMHQTIQASTSNKRTCTHNQNAVTSTVQACRHASEYKNILCVIPVIANTKNFQYTYLQTYKEPLPYHSAAASRSRTRNQYPHQTLTQHQHLIQL
jgi:hypothetical protein